MPTLQKRPTFGMKMTESWLFMDQFPPNHHIMSFLVHNDHFVKSKQKIKKLKKLGLEHFVDLMTMLQNGQNLA